MEFSAVSGACTSHAGQTNHGAWSAMRLLNRQDGDDCRTDAKRDGGHRYSRFAARFPLHAPLRGAGVLQRLDDGGDAAVGHHSDLPNLHGFGTTIMPSKRKPYGN